MEDIASARGLPYIAVYATEATDVRRSGGKQALELASGYDCVGGVGGDRILRVVGWVEKIPLGRACGHFVGVESG